MPMDSNYCGAVDRGLLGGPQSAHAQRREMRRALRNAGIGSCPTCQNGYQTYDGVMLDGEMQTGMMMSPGGGSCPTCQGQGGFSMDPQMMGTPMMDSQMMGSPMMNQQYMEPSPSMHQHGNINPTPAAPHTPMHSPAPMEPTLDAPMPPMNPTPTGPAANGTSQFYPTGRAPNNGLLGYQHMPAVSNTPPQVQAFGSQVQPISYHQQQQPQMQYVAGPQYQMQAPMTPQMSMQQMPVQQMSAPQIQMPMQGQFIQGQQMSYPAPAMQTSSGQPMLYAP